MSNRRFIFSYLKRKAGIKHTEIFAGHGGILDRLDSILLGMPFGLTNYSFNINAKDYFNLGSTGSIGHSVLSIIDKKKLFRINYLTANKNYKKI